MAKLKRNEMLLILNMAKNGQLTKEKLEEFNGEHEFIIQMDLSGTRDIRNLPMSTARCWNISLDLFK